MLNSGAVPTQAAIIPLLRLGELSTLQPFVWELRASMLLVAVLVLIFDIDARRFRQPRAIEVNRRLVLAAWKDGEAPAIRSFRATMCSVFTVWRFFFAE
jgi:hypothetical protein